MKNIFLIILLAGSTAFADPTLGSSKSSTVKFDKGLATLAESSISDIKKTIEDAKALGPIKEVKVISWADQEYPADGTKASKDAVKLAEARNDAVKRYLKTLKIHPVKSYNMASRPNAIQELFKTGQAKVKDKMEATGEAPTTNEDTSGIFNTTGKTSESLVLVYTRGNPNKL